MGLPAHRLLVGVGVCHNSLACLPESELLFLIVHPSVGGTLC